MKTIYIVMAQVFYEYDMPIKAFASKVKAQEFADRCNGHLEKKEFIGLVALLGEYPITRCAVNTDFFFVIDVEFYEQI